MLVDIINGFVTHIITNISGFTANNCKGFDNEEIFDYIKTTSLTPNPQQGVIVSYGGVVESDMTSEFGGLVTNWIIIVNEFLPLSGNDDEVNAQIAYGYAFVDDLLQSIVDDPTLGGVCMDTRLVDGEPPMEYVRNGVSTYLLISMRFALLENLS